jgi:hypothetical protein
LALYPLLLFFSLLPAWHLKLRVRGYRFCFHV